MTKWLPHFITCNRSMEKCMFSGKPIRLWVTVYEELVFIAVRNSRCLWLKRSMTEKKRRLKTTVLGRPRYDSDNHSSSCAYLTMCHICILGNKYFGLGVVFYFIAVFTHFQSVCFSLSSHSFFFLFSLKFSLPPPNTQAHASGLSLNPIC